VGHDGLVSEWVRQKREAFEAVEGRHVKGWSGVEMALRLEGPDGHPVFDDPSVHCLHVMVLLADLDHGEAIEVLTYQNDCEWGLQARAAKAERAVWDGIFRWRAFDDLPLGAVSNIRLRHSDRGDIGEVLLQVDGQEVLLVAGEIYETPGERLEYHAADESVLVFTDLAAADAITWSGARPQS